MQFRKQQLELDIEQQTPFQIQKGVHQGYILLHYLFNLYVDYIIINAGLEEAQAGIKISGRNNNLRYVDDTTFMAEDEEELKSLLMKVKEESEKVDLKLNIQGASLVVQWWGVCLTMQETWVQFLVW